MKWNEIKPNTPRIYAHAFEQIALALILCIWRILRRFIEWVMMKMKISLRRKSIYKRAIQIRMPMKIETRWKNLCSL